MNTGRVTIYIVTWNNEQFIETIVKRIHETTSYPFRLVVSENKSENSPAIREKLISLKEKGLVDKIYAFDQNTVGTAQRFTPEHDEADRLKEGRSFYVTTDHDAYIKGMSDVIPDWLEHYATVLEDAQSDVRAIRMRPTTGHLAAYIGACNPRPSDTSLRYNDIEKWYHQSRVEGKLHKKYDYLSSKHVPTNYHFQAVTESAMTRWFEMHPTCNPVDGNIWPYLVKEHNVHIYAPAYVENLSVFQHFPDPTGTVQLDPKYVEDRKKVFRSGKNESGYSFLEYKPRNLTFKII